jgi:histidyl-tRNA synthetase
MSQEITKPRSISGFPEWLPAQQRVQDRFMDTIRRVFESYGFCHLETSAVELTEVLAAKGVESKEIYSLSRLQAEEDEENRYSLHFDLTVPFARYVALNQGQLVFPFKRYQIQKVWRGERPAQGRFREFYQCDIDIVGIDQLPVSFDAELLEVMGALFGELKLGQVEFRINHRKLLQGFYGYLGIAEDCRAQVLIEVDKIEKIGQAGVLKRLSELGLTEAQGQKIVEFASSRHGSEGLRTHLENLGIEDSVFRAGIEELCELLDQIPAMSEARIIWDGSITRGLNYYTGVIFETTLVGAEGLGSICSGGRYEDLCSRFSKTKMPGVGISLGLTRLLSHLFNQEGFVDASAQSPSEVLLIAMEAGQLLNYRRIAHQLRQLGWNVELSPVGKLKKLMTIANRKGIPQVVIPNEDGSFEWKNMLSGEQLKLSETELFQKNKV